jgi:hypothetical protein
MNKAMAAGPRSQKAHLALIEQWKDVPDGTPVIVTKDDGTEVYTTKRSVPWMLGASSRDAGHTAVMMVEGISGGYGLWRIRKAQPIAKTPNLPALMWSVVGHQDPDDLKDGKCGTCGAVFREWHRKVDLQGGALQEDCCRGVELRKKD